jgi:gliding motility-associated-like protein
LNKPFYILFFVFCNAFSFAQINLVPNPSFEDTLYCPNGLADFTAVENWTNPTLATPDYFNECDIINSVGVPNNYYGYQTAHSGKAYVGIGSAFGSIDSNYREYIQIKLLDSLIANKTYHLAFFINKSDSANLCISNFGIALSSNLIGGPFSTVINFTPQITSPNGLFLTDNLNWIKIEANYQALGGEYYMTVGYFGDDANADTISCSNISNTNLSRYSYYYLDDFSLIEINEDEIFPNIFSPNNDGINDVWYSIYREYDLVEIYNRWGIKIAELLKNDQKWDGTTSYGIKCEDGIYYFIAKTEKTATKGFIHLIR